MKFLILSLCFLNFSFPIDSALATGVKCRADKVTDPSLKKMVAVTKMNGTVDKRPIETEFEKIRFFAIWQLAGQQETQSRLTMGFGDVESTIYDFSLAGHVGPINLMSKRDLRFQCWVE